MPLSTSLVNLTSLLDFSGLLNESCDDEFIASSALLTVMGKLRLSRAAVLTQLGERDGEFTVLSSKGKVEVDSVPFFSIGELRSLQSGIPGESELLSEGFDFACPLLNSGRVLAVLAFGRITDDPLSPEEVQYCSLVCTIAANALQNARTTRSILRTQAEIEARNQLLSTMFEMSRDFSAVLSRDEILRMFSFRLMGQQMITRFAVITERASGSWEVDINRLGKQIPDEVVREFIAMDSESLSTYDTTHEVTRNFVDTVPIQVVSLMKAQGKVKGLILVGKKMNGANYTKDDLLFIEALGNSAMIGMENARLFEEEVEKKKIESEVNIARDIQRRLLPNRLPKTPGYEFAASNISSKQVGGDYYDFIALDEHRCLIAIADVSGKGIPAALLMANAQAALRCLAPLEQDLPELVARLNTIIYQNTSMDKFITFFVGVLDSFNHTFTYVNAGHNPPYLRRTSGEIVELSEGGVILGILDQTPPFKCQTTSMDLGDVLVMYTDGVSEAMDPAKKEYGDERLKSVIDQGAHLDSDALAKVLIDDVQRHAASAPQSDDITLAIVRRL